jgi:hypothetical protein
MRRLFLPALIASLLISCGGICSFAMAPEDTKKAAASSNEITDEVNDYYSDNISVKDEMDTNYSMKFAGSETLKEFKVGDMVKVILGNRHIISSDIISLERTVIQKEDFKVTIPVYFAFSSQSSRTIKGSIFGIGLLFYLY